MNTSLRLNLCLLISVLPVLLPGQAKMVIDLKVPVLETADLAPAQLGATLYLMQSDWAVVSDVGEEVAVWITDYERHRNILGQQVISCVLELRDPSLLRIGNLRKREQITVRYWPGETEHQRFQQKFLNDLEALSEELKVEAYYLGKEIEATLHSSLK